jgi:hypothetical protein
MKFMAIVLLTQLSVAFASSSPADQISSFEVYEVPVTDAEAKSAPVMLADPGLGTVIAVARELVALGEILYPLIKRGQPEVTTEFAPINVLPTDPSTGRHADPFLMENTGSPVSKKFVGVVKNGFGMTVVSLEFLVHFAPGASYEGRGQYLQNAIIVPSKIWATWGWEVNATMKLQSIANQGTRAAPVAAAVLNMNYTVKNLITHIEKNHLVELNGRGEMNVLP